MGTSRRLLGLVLLLVFVGGGGYLLYREHERQEAERAAAVAAAPATQTPATEAPAAAGEAAGTTSAAPSGAAPSGGDAASGGNIPADSAANAPAADSPAAGGADGTAGETGTPGSTAGPDGGAAPDGASTAADGTAAGDAPATEGAAGTDAGTAATTAATPEETISQPEPVVPSEPGVPSFDIVRVEPGGEAVMAGRSEPGMVIALFANGQEIGRTRANDSGEWVITLERPFGPGEYVITVVGATPDGARQVESVDRIAVSIPQAKTEPPMVALMSPNAPTKVLQQPEAPATAVAAASSTPAAGQAGEGAGDSPAAGTATASTATPSTVATTGTGAPPVAATPAPAGAGDAAAAPPPAWAQPFAGEGGTASDSAAAAPQAGPATAIPAITGLAVGLVEKDGDRLTVAGASLPGATVRVYVNDAPLGDAVADAAGRWTFTGRHPVDAGDHTVRADQVDPATGAVVARAAVPFEVLSAAEIASAPATPAAPAVALPAAPAASADTAGSPAPAETATAAAAKPVPAAASATRKIRIRKGDDLWTLAERYYGKRAGVRYTAIYRANRKQIRDPDLIYPGQVFVIPR